MRFLVSEIRDARVVEREDSVKAEDLLGPAPEMVAFHHPVTSKVQARMTRDGEIIFSGHVKTVISYQCSRCLDVFDRPIDLEFQQVVPVEDQQEIDMSGEIRETILVDLPVRALCREACRGICPICGTNLNKSSCRCAVTHVDTRWDALKKFPFK
ncbi:MAG: DUF177 domain-containing protein [Elusimicrobia bacterium]|nr:DUF177 domain-containing protein [Elusimicrobiota bacterium]